LACAYGPYNLICQENLTKFDTESDITWNFEDHLAFIWNYIKDAEDIIKGIRDIEISSLFTFEEESDTR
jgi:hypothetical protein